MPEQILYFHTYPELELGSQRERDESVRGVHRAFCAEWRKGGLAAAEPHLVLVPEPYRQLSARELARRFMAVNFPEVHLGRGRRNALVGTYQLGPLSLAYVFLRTSLPSLAEPVWPEAPAPGLLALPAPDASQTTGDKPGTPGETAAEATAIRSPKLGKVGKQRPAARTILRRRSALWAGASTAAAAVVLAAMRFPPPKPQPVTNPKGITPGTARVAAASPLSEKHTPPVAVARRTLTGAVAAQNQPSVGVLWASGAARYHSGEFAEAYRVWKEALQRDPENRGLQESVQKAEAKLGP